MYTSLLQMLHSATQPPVRPTASSSPGRADVSATGAASTGPSSTGSTTSGGSTDPGVDLTNTFLQLLSTQLENQSPLDPVDPNQFVAQLAQFDSLGELTQIQEGIQTLVGDVTSTSGASSNAANSTGVNAGNAHASAAYVAASLSPVTGTGSTSRSAAVPNLN